MTTEDEESGLKEPLFKDLDAEDDTNAPTELESLCVNCGENVSFWFIGFDTKSLMNLGQ